MSRLCCLMTDTKVYVKVPEKHAKLAKHFNNNTNNYTKFISHFKYYHVILLKHGQLFHSDMHIIKSE